MTATEARQLREEIDELYLSADRMKAVAQSFAREYIDTPQSAEAVAATPEHFSSLYNAILVLMCDVTDRVQKVDSLYKEG